MSPAICKLFQLFFFSFLSLFISAFPSQDWTTSCGYPSLVMFSRIFHEHVCGALIPDVSFMLSRSDATSEQCRVKCRVTVLCMPIPWEQAIGMLSSTNCINCESALRSRPLSWPHLHGAHREISSFVSTVGQHWAGAPPSRVILARKFCKISAFPHLRPWRISTFHSAIWQPCAVCVRVSIRFYQRCTCLI